MCLSIDSYYVLPLTLSIVSASFNKSFLLLILVLSSRQPFFRADNLLFFNFEWHKKAECRKTVSSQTQIMRDTD